MLKHDLSEGTQIKYGYIWWKAENDDEYKSVFPTQAFDIKIGDDIIRNRKVDWKRHRLYVGRNVLKNLGKYIIINKKSDNLIEIETI